MQTHTMDKALCHLPKNHYLTIIVCGGIIIHISTSIFMSIYRKIYFYFFLNTLKKSKVQLQLQLQFQNLRTFIDFIVINQKPQLAGFHFLHSNY